VVSLASAGAWRLFILVDQNFVDPAPLLNC